MLVAFPNTEAEAAVSKLYTPNLYSIRPKCRIPTRKILNAAQEAYGRYRCEWGVFVLVV